MPLIKKQWLKRKQKRRKNKEKMQQEKENKEKEKSMKELSSRKRSLSERKTAIMKEETEPEAEVKMAEELFHESNERLKAAIKAKNLEHVSVVQSLLDVAIRKKWNLPEKDWMIAERRRNQLT